MSKKLAGTVMAGWVVVAGAGMSSAHAATALVDFETNPALATGPYIFVALPSPQTIVTAPATFTGASCSASRSFSRPLPLRPFRTSMASQISATACRTP